MKSIALILLLLLAFTLHAQDEPPELTLAQAAQIAQQTVESLQLGPEYYVRSIQLVPPTMERTERQYEARFEPNARRTVKKESAPEPSKYKVIVVSMDGKGSVVERERPIGRRIERRPVETGPQKEAQKGAESDGGADQPSGAVPGMQ